jgi:hypothetical protein
VGVIYENKLTQLGKPVVSVSAPNYSRMSVCEKIFVRSTVRFIALRENTQNFIQSALFYLKTAVQTDNWRVEMLKCLLSASERAQQSPQFTVSAFCILILKFGHPWLLLSIGVSD